MRTERIEVSVPALIASKLEQEIFGGFVGVGVAVVMGDLGTGTQGREVTITVNWFTELQRLMNASPIDSRD